MAGKKQILVVDDHFEILEFLRSMLEQSNPDYQVLGVPSAEEGFLEMRRTPFDLLITDVRLPGMSGFELVRKVRQFAPTLPIIMITAYSTWQGKQEAEELGALRYFEKPLDTEALLAAVYTALYKDQPAAAQPTTAEPARTAAARAMPPVQDDVMARLRTLRQDTGAAQIILARREGAILAQVGDQPALNAARLTELVAAELEMSFQLAEQLQSSEPLTIQYQAGSKVDLYTANIGRDHFLMLLFDVQARRGRIGTVWIFAQRAIKDLKGMLPVPAIPRVGSPDAEPAGQERQQQPEAGVRSEVEAANLANVEPIPAREEESSDTMEELEEPELTAVDIAALAEALGGVEPAGEELDLDAFWDEAASDVGGTGSKGLTFEEAMKRGLLPPEFGEEGR